MSPFDVTGICECEKKRSLGVVGSVASVCLSWGVSAFFPALAARGHEHHICLRVLKCTLDCFFSVESHSHCNYCWSGFKTKPAKAEWRQHSPTMLSYVVLWAWDSHEWRTKNFAFTWMNHSLPTETGHSKTSTECCWIDILLLISYISLR